MWDMTLLTKVIVLMSAHREDRQPMVSQIGNSIRPLPHNTTANPFSAGKSPVTASDWLQRSITSKGAPPKGFGTPPSGDRPTLSFDQQA
jgi:hypothetical protein